MIYFFYKENYFMEIWDIYDKNRQKTDKTMVRGTPFEKGNYITVIHGCIFNHKNEMLIQQRQSTKNGWPNLWDVTVGGSAVHNETSSEAFIRELYEELGIEVHDKDLRPHITINFENGFDDFYLIEQEVNLEDIKLQYEEVQAVKWATQEEILEKLENNEFVPYQTHFIPFLFVLRNQKNIFETLKK